MDLYIEYDIISLSICVCMWMCIFFIFCRRYYVTFFYLSMWANRFRLNVNHILFIWHNFPCYVDFMLLWILGCMLFIVFILFFFSSKSVLHDTKLYDISCSSWVLTWHTFMHICMQSYFWKFLYFFLFNINAPLWVKSTGPCTVPFADTRIVHMSLTNCFRH